MPRITDPFTPMFHELTESMMLLPLNGTQFRILLWAARNSYGRNGAKFTAYSWGRIADEIESDRSRVSREGRDLIAKGILLERSLAPDEKEIGICKNRIIELGGVRKRTGGANSHRANQTRPGVSKTHPPFHIEKKKESPASSPDSLRLTARFEAVLKRNGVRKLPDRDAGLAAADLLLREDQVPLAQALAVLEFATSSAFWKPTILSVGKFREKFETLRLQMEAQAEKSSGAGSAPVIDVHDRANQVLAARQQGGTA